MSDPEGLTPGSEFAAMVAARRYLTSFALAVQPDYEVARAHRCIAEHLEAVEHGDIKRLWIRTHPRLGKSTLAARRFIPWYFGLHPEREVLLATHTAGLAEAHGRVIRDTMRAPAYRAVFPGTRLQGKSDDGEGACDRFETRAGGSFFAAGIRGGYTGKGAHLFVIDDPVKDAMEATSQARSDDNIEWYAWVARTRLARDGAIVGIDTNWGDLCLGSRLLAAGGWHFLDLPAMYDGGAPCCSKGDWRTGHAEVLCSERWPAEALLAVAAELEPLVGSDVWDVMFQGRAVPRGGYKIRRDWLGTYAGVPHCEQIVGYWDLTSGGASSTSWNAAVVLGLAGGRFHVLHVERFKGDADEILRRVESVVRAYPGAAQYIEPKAAGPSVVAILGREIPQVMSDDDMPRGGKESRLQAVLPFIQAGRLLLPTQAPWLAALVHELTRFPRATSNDQVDALSGAMRILLGEGIRHRPAVAIGLRPRAGVAKLSVPKPPEPEAWGGRGHAALDDWELRAARSKA